MRLAKLRARSLLQLCCIVALLLAAQHSALTHALWHAHEHFPAQHRVHSDDGGAHKPDGRAASSLCLFHAAFGEVLGGAPVTHYSFSGPASADEAPLHRQRALLVQELLAPRSRGPPSLL